MMWSLDKSWKRNKICGSDDVAILLLMSGEPLWYSELLEDAYHFSYRLCTFSSKPKWIAFY